AVCQDVGDRFRGAALPAGPDGAAVGVAFVVVDPAPADLLPAGGPAALLRQHAPKSASGRADPCRPQARLRRKAEGSCRSPNVMWQDCPAAAVQRRSVPVRMAGNAVPAWETSLV